MKKAILTVIMFMSVSAHAQTAPTDWQNLVTWLQSQQATVGTASPIKGKLAENTMGSTSWDLISIGQSGINVAKAGALDFVDVGPTMDIGTDQVTRYGGTVAIHFGNIYNTTASKLPKSIASHVNLVSLPNFIIAPQFLIPVSGKWTWGNDFKVSATYRFGGS